MRRGYLSVARNGGRNLRPHRPRRPPFRFQVIAADGPGRTIHCVRLPSAAGNWQSRLDTRDYLLRGRCGRYDAIFRQINLANQHTHHDALEFPDGEIVLLTFLQEGQQATVLQLPVAEKPPTSSAENKNAPISGQLVDLILT
jgi:hypothetical protein